jgi:hypothetical protein
MENARLSKYIKTTSLSMLPSIESLLVLQDRDQKIRILRLELKNLPDERASLDTKLAAGSSQLNAGEAARARRGAGEKEARNGGAGEAGLDREVPDPAIPDAQERGIPGADQRDQAVRGGYREDRGSGAGADGGCREA